MNISLKDYWYVLAESRELTSNLILHREVLSEWIAVFRDEDGVPRAFQDRCIHRNVRLSQGQCRNGKIRCSYHGWEFDKSGQVTNIPSMGDSSSNQKANLKNKCATTYEVVELDGYIYIRLNNNPLNPTTPFKMPFVQDKSYTTIRLINYFDNDVTNCVENFVDVPHTVFVHPKIFRNAQDKKIELEIKRSNDHVKVNYLGEKSNFGIFSFFLNPKKVGIVHTDEFYSPNVTTVNYYFSKKHFIITSQSVPINDYKTAVYTSLTYNYGLLNFLSRPIVKWHGQKIIDQDLVILKEQMNCIRKYGKSFTHSPSDFIHIMIESIRNEISEGRDPKLLPDKDQRITVWI